MAKSKKRYRTVTAWALVYKPNGFIFVVSKDRLRSPDELGAPFMELVKLTGRVRVVAKPAGPSSGRAKGAKRK